MIDERKMAKCQREQAKTSKEEEVAALRYRELDRQVKRSCRRDKKTWMEERSTEAQTAADRNDTKTLLIKEEQDGRWIEHFTETLN